jgi:hypothetical protein
VVASMLDGQPHALRKVFAFGVELAVRSGANLEQGPGLNGREVRPTELNCTTMTCKESVFARHGCRRAGLGVKGSQVQILSSRRQKRAVPFDGGAARFACDQRKRS